MMRLPLVMMHRCNWGYWDVDVAAACVRVSTCARVQVCKCASVQVCTVQVCIVDCVHCASVHGCGGPPALHGCVRVLVIAVIGAQPQDMLWG